MSPVRIALIDDHSLFRSGISSLINGFQNFKVILEASNGKEFIENLQLANSPDIILLDLNMPVMDGFETAAWIKKNCPAASVIILSMFDDSYKVIRMLKFGIRGYILKDSKPEDFKMALKTVADGNVFYPGFVMQHLVRSLNKPEKIWLSDREINFLELACTDLSYREIAEKMCLSIRTIDGYRDRLFSKFDVKSRTSLVIYALKSNYITL